MNIGTLLWNASAQQMVSDVMPAMTQMYFKCLGVLSRMKPPSGANAPHAQMRPPRYRPCRRPNPATGVGGELQPRLEVLAEGVVHVVEDREHDDEAPQLATLEQGQDLAEALALGLTSDTSSPFGSRNTRKNSTRMTIMTMAQIHRNTVMSPPTAPEHARADGVDGEDADGSPGGPDSHGASTGAVREPDRHASRTGDDGGRQAQAEDEAAGEEHREVGGGENRAQMTWPMIARIMPVHVAILGPHLRTRMDVGNAMMRAPMGTRPMTLAIMGAWKVGLTPASQPENTGKVTPAATARRTRCSRRTTDTMRHGQHSQGSSSGHLLRRLRWVAHFLFPPWDRGAIAYRLNRRAALPPRMSLRSSSSMSSALMAPTERAIHS